jgi:murein DD-endopeptidase MepM/ murein hydrolase activator NlpD
MISPFKWRKNRVLAFDIVVVPVGESGKTRKFHLTWWKLTRLVAAIVAVCVILTLAAITFTPLMRLVPIPASVLEVRYGRQLFDTQERLKSLAEDVLILKTYNLQLRKALGEKVTNDTTHTPVRAANQKNETKTAIPSVPTAVSAPPAGSPSMDEYDLMPTAENLTPRTQSRTTTGKDLALPLLKPTEGYLTQGYDPSRGHLGIDIAGKQGTAVLASADGIVMFSGWTYEDGNTVMVSHGSGYMTVYKHNQQLLKDAPSGVRRGEPIALLGTSGHTSLGPHLHFEVWRDGAPQDPNQFLLTPVGTQ